MIGMPFDVLGIIAPHPPIMVEEVGGADARVTAASAAALRSAANLLERFKPQTVVIVSPHAPGFADAFTVTTADHVRGDLARFGAPTAGHDVAGDPDLARAIIDEAVAKKAPLVEIIPGKGSGALKKHVLRFLQQKEIKALYHRVEKDSDNFGRVFVHFRWK